MSTRFFDQIGTVKESEQSTVHYRLTRAMYLELDVERCLRLCNDEHD